MPIMNQSFEAAATDESTLQITTITEGFPITLAELQSVYNGSRSLDMLVFQMADRLQAKGVNPYTATIEQVAAALNNEVFRWGN